MPDPAETPTNLLLAWGRGERTAFDRLVPLVTHELHQLARRYLRDERRGHTLQPTALVNEAYLRLIELDRIQWQDRAHFFAMAARTMRRVLVDHARARDNDKRGGGVPKAAQAAEPLRTPPQAGPRRGATWSQKSSAWTRVV